MADRSEETMAAALKPFGWTCEPEFWRRYYSDPWVFNLANAVERMTEDRDRLLAALWDIRMMAEKSTTDDPPWRLPTEVIHSALAALGDDRIRAQVAAAARR